MELKFVDPRSLKDNPDKARRSKSSPQADALLLATIKAVGIVEPPIVTAETDGGNGFVIDEGHRRAKQAIAAGLEEIAVLLELSGENPFKSRSYTNVARQILQSSEDIAALVREKRLRELNRGARKLVEDHAKNPIEVVMREMEAGRIELIPDNDENREVIRAEVERMTMGQPQPIEVGEATSDDDLERRILSALAKDGK